jgi:hypothetical protein
MARRSKLTWHEEVLDASGLRGAQRLALAAKGFYLAGGTGLALRLGHRVSLDLDLFSRDNPLGGAERLAVVKALRASGPVEVRESSQGTLHLILEGTRASLMRYRYPLLARPDPWRGVPVAALKDIAAMKVSAIIGRGSKKDFIDLHAIAATAGLDRLLRGAAKKFSDHHDFLLQASRALVYFEDAENDPMPRPLKRVDWEAVKRYFEREAPAIVRRLLASVLLALSLGAGGCAPPKEAVPPAGKPLTLYDRLAKDCDTRGSKSCCLASVLAMRRGGFQPASPEGNCPAGTTRNMMRCEDSYQWCEPATPAAQ